MLLPVLFYVEWGRGEFHPDFSWMIPLTACLLVMMLYEIYYGLIALGPEFSTLFDIIASMLTIIGAYFLFAETLYVYQWVGGL